MCGEIDDNILVNQELLERFSVMSKMLGLATPEKTADGPEGLATAEGRGAYMDELFRFGLQRALGDATSAEDDEAIDAMASQAIAFARLAGFIAGQLPPSADLFRSVIEAVTAGQAETVHLEKHYRDTQAEAHGHHHDDDHHHH